MNNIKSTEMKFQKKTIKLVLVTAALFPSLLWAADTEQPSSQPQSKVEKKLDMKLDNKFDPKLDTKLEQKKDTAKVDVKSNTPKQAASKSLPPQSSKDPFGIYRGLLGKQQIQLTIMPGSHGEGSFSGNYFIFGEGRELVLLSGEYEDHHLQAEESENGTDISGLWDGKFQGQKIEGEWISAIQDLTVTLDLKKVQDLAGKKTTNKSNMNKANAVNVDPAKGKLQKAKNGVVMYVH